MPGRAFSAGLLLLAAVLAATWLGLQPPSPLPSSAPGPIEIVVADQSRGLPPAAAAVAAARPSGVVTQQEGDVTLFTRRVRLEPEAPR